MATHFLFSHVQVQSEQRSVKATPDCCVMLCLFAVAPMLDNAISVESKLHNFQWVFQVYVTSKVMDVEINSRAYWGPCLVGCNGLTTGGHR